MGVVDWLVLSGVVAYPLLFAHAVRQYRGGERSRTSFLRGAGVGATGFAVLLQQLAERLLSTPWDDVVAVASLPALFFGVYAIFRGYLGDDDDDPAGASN